MNDQNYSVVPVLTNISGKNGIGERWSIVQTNVSDMTNLVPITVGSYLHPDGLIYVNKTEKTDVEMCGLMGNMKIIGKDRSIDDEDPFWDYFLEEKNFKLLVALGKKNFKMFDEEIFRDMIPGLIDDFDFDGTSSEYKFTIHQQREMTLRSILDISLKYPEITEPEHLKAIIKTLYMGALEYSGYSELGTWIQYTGDLTFLEHELLGLEIG